MAVTKHTTPPEAQKAETTDRAHQFWSKNGRILTIALVALVLIIGGYLAYNSMIKKPNQQKAEEAIFKAEEYYRADSLDKALNGDGLNLGLLKIIDRYGNSPAGNRAHFMAASIYLKKGDFKNAIKHLEDFSTDAPQIQARAYGLQGDAWSELGFTTNNNGNKDKAAGFYQKAADAFPKDEENASEYLHRAAQLYESMGKNKDAIDLYKKIKEKYPATQRGFEADKYLGRLGEVK